MKRFIPKTRLSIRLIAISILVYNCSAVKAQINNAADLIKAVNNGLPGDTVSIAAGTFQLTQPLQPKRGMVIRGAGICKTIITGADSWDPGTAGLPDDAVKYASVNRNAYIFDMGSKITGVCISDMTLTGPKLHGALSGYDCDSLEMYNLLVKDFLWSGIRTFAMNNASIHDNIFEDAGGKFNGTTGGGMYLTWTSHSVLYNNLFFRSPASSRDFYGIKGREIRNSRIHNNTILIRGFSIEFPHENDWDTEIDHNYLAGTISIPKGGGGGSVPSSGITFHIHHNYFGRTYSLEWGRRGAEIDHNLFDFLTTDDGGNLVSSWSDLSVGPTHFHNNLIKNPGRGVFWTTYAYNNLNWHNNHVIANTTITPRTEGFFGFPVTGMDFSTIKIRDNIIECIGTSRPLMRNTASYAALIENNTLINVKDTASYANPKTSAKRGPLQPLNFYCGINGEYLVNDWIVTRQGGAALRNPDNPAKTVGGLSYSYYEKTGMSSVSALSGTVKASGVAVNFNINPRQRNDDFGFVFDGYVDIPSDGIYTFFTDSDEGSVLYIGNQMVVDNDGLHASRERYGHIGLKAGKHTIQVRYFERTGGEKLVVSWQGPCISKRAIPATSLYRLDGTVGIFEESIFSINAYPNPASDALFVRLAKPDPRMEITLCNALGQVFLPSSESYGDLLQVNISGIAPGVYILRLITPEGVANRKIIIQ